MRVEPYDTDRQQTFSRRAAILGGVTCVFEMPNPSPSTTTPEALADKVARATGRMACDFAFYYG
ncbi:MAG: dihydroorotase, partial [Pseudomonadota bacterium]